jgi:alkylhydroperoxidase family enzyme
MTMIVVSTTPQTRSAEPLLVPVLEDAQAWSRLPPLADGEQQHLPIWARMLADSLPRTTAVMIELDTLQREHNPLGAVLAGKVRWLVATANRCPYTAACAEADLRRAGLRAEELVALANGSDHRESGNLSSDERQAMQFARRLTLEPDAITDEQVANLIETFGEAKVVALVLLVAHANFQDRLLLTLEAVADLGDPVGPLTAQFAKPAGDAQPAVPERIMPEPAPARAVPEHIDDAEWRSLDFNELKRNLDRQKWRAGRIRVPPWEDVARTIPEDQRPEHPVRIVWTLVCRGYQPELAAGWSACLRTFAEESKQDRVFEESVFWVITRTLHCFY